MHVSFTNLRRSYHSYRRELDLAISAVVASQRFTLGDELQRFESEFAAYIGTRYCYGVASGTDALIIALTALQLGPGDEVILPVNSFIASALAVTLIGATPIFVDVDQDTYLLDTQQVRNRISSRTKAVMPVHLYGSPCDMGKILELAAEFRLAVVEDACQAHGAIFAEKKMGTWGNISAFSFYPTKNLGAYGDGGAVCTDDPILADRLELLRNYGQRVKYSHETIGRNSRLDELQSAVLRVKLRYLDANNGRRQQIASEYIRRLPHLKFQQVDPQGRSCYHLFELEIENRDEVIRSLSQNGVETHIHYPIPIHLQKCYQELGYVQGDFPVAERLSRQLVSLPMHEALNDVELDYVIAKLMQITG